MPDIYLTMVGISTKLAIFFYYLWLYLAVSGYFCLFLAFLAISGGLFLAISGFPDFLAVPGGFWLFIAFSGCFWLFLNDIASITVFIQLVKERLKIPSVEPSIKRSSQLCF